MVYLITAYQGVLPMSELYIPLCTVGQLKQVIVIVDYLLNVPGALSQPAPTKWRGTPEFELVCQWLESDAIRHTDPEHEAEVEIRKSLGKCKSQALNFLPVAVAEEKEGV
jgi:hypothetical protein